MSKRLLMLSTATAALVTGAAFADTTIDSTSGSKTDPYTTGALLVSTDAGTTNAGNIIVKSGYSIGVSGLAQGAVTIDSNSWLLNQGTISNKDKDGASAIHVDMSSNPNYTGTSITGLTTSSTASVTGIYLDSSSVTSVSGSGVTKYGIYLDTGGCVAVCTFNGAITVASGSTLDVTGDKSVAIQLGAAGAASSTVYGVLQGNLTIAGTVSATAATTSNNSSASLAMFGLLSNGKITGNVTLASSGTLAAYGQGAVGMLLTGQGVTGTLDINGALTSTILSSSNAYNPNQKINTTTNPEAGAALEIGASIGGGVSIGATGSVKAQGAGPAVVIGSSIATAQTGPITIGLYSDSADPGFSFYNRGSISSSYTNYNKPVVAVQLVGYGIGEETIFSGGFYTSGAISASAVTSNDATTSSGVTAYGLTIGSNVKLLQNETLKNAEDTVGPGDQAALVVGTSGTTKGSITASISGTRGGTAIAISIADGASVPSLINTGTISAAVYTTDATLKGNTTGSTNPLVAYGILSYSNTLASIVNTGTIAAQAGYGTSYSALDNNSQIAVAIQVAGNDKGTTIENYAYGSQAATIVGDVIFGAGKNQVLDLQGVDAAVSTVIGNVTFGTTTDTASIDILHIGVNSALTGKVVNNAANGVQVDIDGYGALNLLNTTTPLTASTVTVLKNGTFNLGVNKSLTTSGMVTADVVSFANGSHLGVNYASFLPQKALATGSNAAPTYAFVLMTTATHGQMQIGQDILDTFNNGIDAYGNSTRPYLLKTATMCNTNNGACAGFVPTDTTKDYLLINVQMKQAVDPSPKIGDPNTNSVGVHTDNYIGLTAGSVAVVPLSNITAGQGVTTTLFEQANLALVNDDELGSAFLNGVTTAAQAAKAYNDMAPGVTGGTRAIAISITDQATGPVASRQRALRMYGKASGDFTVWGQEFVQMIKDPGRGALDPNTGFKTSPGFKDHGFGLSVGLDGGSPKSGWYGGALTFYAGDVNELARSAHQNQQWYLASLYSVWRGKGLFFDAKIDAGYGQITGKRTIILARPQTISTYWPNATTYYAREADNKHAGALLSGGFTTGGLFSYGAATFMPQLSVDGLYLREEGYTENNPNTTTVGDGFDLKVNQYYAKSLRAFVGFDARYDLQLWDFYLQPEARAGYRYDFISDPVKLKAAFAYATIAPNSVTPGSTFELTGPDPSQGNFVLGGTIAASADTWTLGLNFDFVKGSNGAIQQVATVHLLGRI